MKIPTRYGWIADIADAPKMIVEGFKLGQLDTTEFPGPKSNPEILALAAEAGLASIYHSDETAWCAVAQTVVCLRAGKEVPFTMYDRMRAVSFLHFGTPVDPDQAMFGDVLIFKRPGGYHVGMYAAEDEVCFHTMGGNESNQYNIVREPKTRILAVRRPHYNNQPASVKKIIVSPQGAISDNEA